MAVHAAIDRVRLAAGTVCIPRSAARSICLMGRFAQGLCIQHIGFRGHATVETTMTYAHMVKALRNLVRSPAVLLQDRVGR